MIDRAEVAVHVGVFPAFWFIHPLVLASALAVWLLGLMLAYLFDWFPRLERWIASSKRNYRIASVGFSALFGNGFAVYLVFDFDGRMLFSRQLLTVFQRLSYPSCV